MNLRKNSNWLLLISLSYSLCAVSAACQSKVRLKQSVLVEIPGSLYSPLQTSPDGRHVFTIVCLASACKNSTAWAVYRDGKQIGQYDGPFPRFSYAAESSPVGLDILYSKDGEHYAFKAQRNGEDFVVFDGVEGPHYEHVVLDANENQLNSAGDALAYVVGQASEKHLIVTGPGVRTSTGHTWSSPAYTDIYQAQFSPDGKKLAYFANADNRVQVFLGKLPRIEPIDQCASDVRYIQADRATFSADSQHFAFMAYDNGNPGNHVILDGKSIGVYPELDSISFSPDGKHLAFVVTSDAIKAIAVVIDGTVYPLSGALITADIFDGSNEIIWNPDSEHLVYAIRRNKLSYFVVDSVLSRGYARIEPFRSHLLDDGRLAFSVFDGTNWSTSIGEERLPNRRLLAITPNGVHRAFYQGSSETELLVDGKRYSAPGPIHRGHFSTSGMHFFFSGYGSSQTGNSLYFDGFDGNIRSFPNVKMSEVDQYSHLLSQDETHIALLEPNRVTVDGVSILPLDIAQPRCAPHSLCFAFDENDSFHAFAMRDSKVIRIDGHF